MKIESIQSIINGDKQAFKDFYDSHYNKSLMIATSITRNKELAKEATQETFIRVYRNLHQYDSSKPFEPWFYKILTNECNRILKKENKVVLLHQEFENDVLFSESRNEINDDLYEVIQALDDTYRIPLILKYIKGFSELEISEILTVNQNTIKTRLYKARAMIKKKYESYEEGGVTNA